jgi:hypothetical protein
LGFADYLLEIPAGLRARGSVICGENFDPFGITRARNPEGDEQDHCTLDFTGNLLRSSPLVGTHDNHGWYDTVTRQQNSWVGLERAWMGGAAAGPRADGRG